MKQAQNHAGIMMIAHPAVLSPAVMKNHAAIKIVGSAVIARRTVSLLMVILAVTVTGMRAQQVTDRPMPAQVVTVPTIIVSVTTGTVMSGPVMIVSAMIVLKVIAPLMAILAVTVTGTLAQQVTGLNMVGLLEIVSAMIASRNGVAMARHRKGVIPTRTIPRMAAHRGARRKRAAHGLAVAVTWTPAPRHLFGLRPGPKTVRSNVALAITRSPVANAPAGSLRRSQMAKL